MKRVKEWVSENTLQVVIMHILTVFGVAFMIAINVKQYFDNGNSLQLTQKNFNVVVVCLMLTIIMTLTSIIISAIALVSVKKLKLLTESNIALTTQNGELLIAISETQDEYHKSNISKHNETQRISLKVDEQ